MTDDQSAAQDPAPALALFRQEAIASATTRLGSPVRPIGPGTWLVAVFLLSLVICAALFLSFGRYARKETVVGTLQPSTGAARVAALQIGVISEILVDDGQQVHEGDPMIVVSRDIGISPGDAASGSLSALMEAEVRQEVEALTQRLAANRRLALASVEELRARREGVLADQRQLEESSALQRDRIALVEQTLESGRALNARKLFSDLQLRQREEAVLAARQTLADMRRAMAKNEATLRQMTAEQARLEAQVSNMEAELEGAGAQLAQKTAQVSAERRLIMRASRTGQVSLAVRVGETVEPGRMIATILPVGEGLNAELWVPSAAVGFLRPGDKVRLLYDAFPYQKFGVGEARVVSVATVPVNPADLTTPIETREALYKVIARPEREYAFGYGKRWPLSPGMRLKADLVLDQRSFFEWIFDPLLAASRRNPDADQ